MSTDESDHLSAIHPAPSREAVIEAHRREEPISPALQSVIDGTNAKIRAAFAPSLGEARLAEGEAVAWRYLERGEWKYVGGLIKPQPGNSYPVEPLYAHPSHVQAEAGEAVAWQDVIAERRRQVEAEGWTPEHDDEHSEGQMAAAAVCYAFTAVRSPHYIGHIWPWSSDWFKPTSKRRNLVKASALILAEIERLDRAALSNPGEQVE